MTQEAAGTTVATGAEPAGTQGVRELAVGIWCFLAVGVAGSALCVLIRDAEVRSFLWNVLALIAAAAAIWGLARNRPAARGVWQLLAAGVVLFVAGDIVYDIAVRSFGASDGYPWSDILYLAAYPVFAVALWKLAKGHFSRGGVLDAAVVAVAGTAVVWTASLSHVIDHGAGSTTDQVVSALYPVMDVVLLVALVLAIFAVHRWNASAWLLVGGFGVMLVADCVYARMVAQGTYTDGQWTDALYPICYFLLAGALMHPSMRNLYGRVETVDEHTIRPRMILLGLALLAAPAIILADEATSSTAWRVTAIVGLTMGLVAWRLSRLVQETNDARVVIAESEARFRALVQHATDIVIVLTPAGRVTYVSPSVRSVFGTDEHQLLGTDLFDYLDDHGIAQGFEVYRQLVEHPEEPVSSEFHVRSMRGDTWHWIEATWTNQLDEPAVRGIVGNLREITDRKRSDEATDAETRVLEQILAGAPIADVARTLLEAVERYVPHSGAIVRLLDAEEGRLTCVSAPSLPADYVRAIEDQVDLEHMEAVLSASEMSVIRDVTATGRSPELQEMCRAAGLRTLWSLPIRSPEGDEFLGLLGVYPAQQRDPDNHERQLLERTRDLLALAIDRAERARQLGHLALHDTLTGLPNRALAQDRLEHALARLGDTDGTGMVAVLFVDLDRFKLVNDGLGHETGDELLVAAARRLTSVVRRGDTVARFGGDEFVVLCEDLDGEEKAIELADRIARALSEPFVLSHAEAAVSASVGIAITADPSSRAASLLRDADAAMYRAKRRGGARHELFDEAMHTQAVTRLLTERALRQALEREELRVLFQPQFDLHTDERVAVEALLRWEHPVRGLVSPGDFLKVAEETGVIVPIGEWVLARACEHVLRMRNDHPDGEAVTVSTNVSARQLQRPDFPGVVARIMREYGISPDLLGLDITESTLLDELDTTTENLQELKELGVRLAIDDFGTGSSSLTYLRRFPFDELKIDRTFTMGLGSSAADTAIVAATIDMAHALGMLVTAEGVETEEQLAHLRDLGCDRAQGYLLGVPEAAPARRLSIVRRRLA
jgi:diguanylate cyclase (GGDEF)-like protein/PAS domain S-box-containing protein